MIAVTICATKSYCYAIRELALRLQPNLAGTKGILIFVSDESPEAGVAMGYLKAILPRSWEAQQATIGTVAETANYEGPAQLLIARMRTEGFRLARSAGAEACWSIDSDVLPPANAYRCMQTMLEFDAGYYAISTCPYPSQGGHLFLGGRGTPHHPILPDYYIDEREVPEDLLARLQTPPTSQEDNKERRDLLNACPPKGNIFDLNGKQYRRRGWFDNAYPGIGRGAVVPVDWCGFGCTLMNREALALADFSGYTGEGTEDLYVIWKKWHPAGLRINTIPHCPCDHVIRIKDKPGEYILVQASHETEPGEYIGHLRTENRPFVS